MFDAFTCGQRAESAGEPLGGSDAAADYDSTVDGKPRYEASQSFLAHAFFLSDRAAAAASRAIPHPGTAETVDGLGKRRTR